MHEIILAIVYAKNEENALEKAKEIFEGMSGKGKGFDYFTLFDDTTSMVSGPARWGNITPVMPAEGEEGSKLINEIFSQSRQEREERIENLRCLLHYYSNDELLEEKENKDGKKDSPDICCYCKKYPKEKKFGDFCSQRCSVEHFNSNITDKSNGYNLTLSNFQYSCSVLGEYSGSSVRLYGNDGEGIITKTNLSDNLDKYKCLYEDKGEKNPNRNLKVWVVPADVHF